jgi:predicted AAA+ superfamily ATPase
MLITGPRQCGKTTLAKQLASSFDYFNYDATEDRLALKNKKLLRGLICQINV